MNNKFFVPFDTARQLKEKWYPQKLATMYYDTFSGGEISLITDRECVSCVVEGNDRHPLFKRLSELYIAAPTYHEVVDWLESKGIYVTLDWVSLKYVETLQGTIEETFGWEGDVKRLHIDWRVTDDYPTREQAINAAILIALEIV